MILVQSDINKIQMYNTVETVTNLVERGKMDISNTQIHGVSIQFIYIQHI